MRNLVHKLKEPNPLNFFDLRKLKVPPAHFEYIVLPLTYNLEKSIVKWIEQHQKGRFYVGIADHLDQNNHFSRTLKVGFENHKELSYFTLACPLLKY